ncbi:MAG: PsiF family protein [Gammaproteobacteria bacterium]
MKKLIVPLFFALTATAFAFASNASAAEGTAMTPQQGKMATCSHESKGMKGEEHKKFMSDCLKGKTQEMKADETTAATKAKSKTEQMTPAQREKMQTCKADAKSKSLKGSDRKKFMSECLKGGG